jgi:beta-glucosidase
MNTPIYQDRLAPVADRVRDLLQRMTLEEKIAQITCLWDAKATVMDAALHIDPAKLRERFPHGIGQMARPSDAKGQGSPREFRGRDARATVDLVNTVQQWAVHGTRLGIPVLFHEESLHGYAAVGATSFPQAIALAGSFDPDLVREVQATVAQEVAARGVQVALSPVLDVARDPRWGRIEETFGEDVHLVTEMSVATVEGLQGVGDGAALAPGKVYATLKHLTGHAQPENGTNVGPAPYSERELREFFFPPFEATIQRAGARVVMASYNEIDGVPSHANPWLLGEVLRGEWGFQGAVVGDYFAIEQLNLLHHVAADFDEAAAQALAAGVDCDLPNGTAYQRLADGVRSGRVPEALLDQAVARMLDLKFRSGLFERPLANADEAQAATHTPQAVALARRAAQRCLTLLTNKGMLPLQAPPAGAPRPTLAVIGPNAAVQRLGGYSGQPPHVVTVLEGLQTRFGATMNVTHAEGVKITEGDDWWADEVQLARPEDNRRRIAEAVELAQGADQIVLVLGDTEQTSREAWATWHLGDRASLDLVGEQQALFDALKALGKPIAVVLLNGRPASTVAIAEQADALIEAWYLGEQGGHALADVLAGDVNPGGKLPVSVPRHVGQLPVFYNHKPSARRGYLFDETKPLFPFGHGLSYTRFSFGAPRLSSPSMDTNGRVQVLVEVSNTGERSGDEVVQLYVRDRIASVTRPVKELKAFQRVTLAAGETRTVALTLDAQALRMWNKQMQRVVEPGEFELMTGPDSVQLQSVVLQVTAA